MDRKIEISKLLREHFLQYNHTKVQCRKNKRIDGLPGQKQGSALAQASELQALLNDLNYNHRSCQAIDQKPKSASINVEFP